MSNILEIWMKIRKEGKMQWKLVTLTSCMLEAIFLKQLKLIISKPYAMFIFARYLNDLNNLFQARKL